MNRAATGSGPIQVPQHNPTPPQPPTAPLRAPPPPRPAQPTPVSKWSNNEVMIIDAEI